jgi:hypothetical protein
MKSYLIFLVFIFLTTIKTFGQSDIDCSRLDWTIDTLNCGEKKIILELEFCGDVVFP